MNSFRKPFIRVSYTIAAILSGILIFISLATYDLNNSLLNSDYHKHLFEKNNVYSHANNLINSSLDDFISNFKKYSPENYEQHKETFSILEKSITPDMVKFNLDNLREGLFLYFKGVRSFLPDISLNPQQKALSEYTGNGNLTEDIKAPTQALAKIDRISLNAVLLYINRNDILNYLLLIKFIFFVSNKFTLFSLLGLLLMSVIGLAASKKIADVTKWVSFSFLTCGILGVIASIILFILTFIVIPKNIYPLVMSLPLQREVILAYIKDCTLHASIFLAILGVSFLSLSAGVYLLGVLFPSVFHGKGSDTPAVYNKSNKIIKYSAYGLLFALITFFTGYKLYDFKNGFDTNNFASAFSKLRSTSTVTKIISAENESIYTLHIKLIDSKTNKPVENTKINITGKSGINSKDYYETAITDNSGIAKFTLDKGTFHLSFETSHFPTQYEMPTPFFFDLKSAGITIITINLNTPPESEKPKNGIAEIEVLDKDNNPVTGLELALLDNLPASGYPDNIYSLTNSEGIAIFKLLEGNYKINFTESKFPKQYQLPPTIDASVVPGKTTRYTFRLVDAKVEKTDSSKSTTPKQTTKKKK